MQQLALGSGVEQEGVAAEGEGAVQPKLVLRLVVRLPPRHIVVLHIQLLTAHTQPLCCITWLHPETVSNTDYARPKASIIEVKLACGQRQCPVTHFPALKASVVESHNLQTESSVLGQTPGAKRLPDSASSNAQHCSAVSMLEDIFLAEFRMCKDDLYLGKVPSRSNVPCDSAQK